MLEILCLLIFLYIVALFARVVLSWIPVRPNSPMAAVAGFVLTVTDPVYKPIQKRMKPVRVGDGAVDLTGTVAILGFVVLSRLICG